MKSLIVIQGCGRGIGRALLKGLAKNIDPSKSHILALNRSKPTDLDSNRNSTEFDPNSTTFFPLDIAKLSQQTGSLTDSGSEVAAISAWLSANQKELGIRQIWNVAGVLHPERSILNTFVDPAAWQQASNSFHTNVLGPLRLFSLLVPQMWRQPAGSNPSSSLLPLPLGIFNLSARVSSIEENSTLGGWHSYRASKTAANQIMRNLHLELSRKSNRQDPVPCLSLHPGFVDTDMTRPFHRNMKPGQVWSPDQAAAKLLSMSSSAEAMQRLSGKLYDIQKDEIIPF